MSRRIAIRADASTRIGTGHLRRMRSLATALHADGAQVRFFCRALGIDAASIAGACDLRELAAPSSHYRPGASSPPHAAWAGIDQIDDADEFVAMATDFRPDWVVVDHYAFDARWHDVVRSRLSARIAVVDDVADRPLAPDLLVDHNLHADHRGKYAGLLAREPIWCCGPEHALLDPVFATAPRCRPRDAVERIGIFLGGADIDDATSRVLAGLRGDGFAGDIGIATSSANPNLASLRARVAGDARTTLAVDLPDLASFFAGFDLQIGAGGGATWERLCIGAPSILLALADNQHEVLLPLASRGVATVLPSDWRTTDVCAAVRRLSANPEARRAMSARARAIVDGRGASKVARVLLRSQDDVR